MSTSSSSSAAGLSASGVPVLPSLDNTFGALLIATFIGIMQFGWTAHQCFQYYFTYPEDNWLLKSMVTSVLVLEALHTVLCMHASYYYLVTNYANPVGLGTASWSICLLGVTTGLVILVSQLFFLRRVYLINRKLIIKLIVAFCAILLLGEFGLATGVTVTTFINPTLHNSSQAWINSSGVGLASLADTIMTAALIISLHRSRTGIKRTDGLINILIMYAINTGLVTGVFNILSFAFALALPNNMIYVGIEIVATKLYANSLMTVLNSRQRLATYNSGGVHSMSTLAHSHAHAKSIEDRRYFPSSGNTTIKVTTEMTSTHDMNMIDAKDGSRLV